MKRNFPVLACGTCFVLLLSILFLVPSSSGSPAYENFLDFTEVEEYDDIQKTANHVDFLDRRDRTTYLYKDYGIDHFGNFTHYLDVYRGQHGSASWCAFWSLADVVKGEKAMRDANDEHIFVNFGGTAPPQIYINEYTSGGSFNYKSICYISVGTWYYLKIAKSNTFFSVDIYSTEALRENGGNGDVGYNNLTLSVDYSFRYLYIGNSYDDGLTVQGISDFENLDLQESYCITFYNNTGGIFRVNNVTKTNGTTTEYLKGTILDLSAIPQNKTYRFLNFTWTNGNSTTNPCNYTVTSDMTIYCNFSTPLSFSIGAFIGGIICFIIGLIIGICFGSGRKR